MTTTVEEKRETHTPGPWEASTHPANDPEYCHVWSKSRGRDIALVVRVKNESMVNVGSAEANARLIAAAPEMYEMCKLLLPVMQRDAKDRHMRAGESRRGEHADKLREILAKVEGGGA